MCEIMTICAAIAFTALYAVARRRGKPTGALFTTMLMFWGAALMWAVDCTANAIDGEPFFDFSREDTVLGFIILGAGIAAYAVLALLQRLTYRANAAL